MDFDIGNILYVVITLVAIIAGLLGRKKKPANQSPKETSDESQPGFMENIEKILRMGQENPQVADLQDYEEDIVFDEPKPVASLNSELSAETAVPSRSILDDYDRIMNSMNERDDDASFADGDHLDGSLEGFDMDHEGRANYFEIIKDFDAGTAVVYSAIINRLDY
ncbi:MAG: hypothetical protein GQ579_03590 [Bacteroidales bacterium]|nr:hypothetical protein [Bacteroidales bacterium]